MLVVFPILAFFLGKRFERSNTFPLPTPSQAQTQTVIDESAQSGSNQLKLDVYEIVDNSQTPHFPTGIKYYQKNWPFVTVVRWKNYLIGVPMEMYREKSAGAFFGDSEKVHYTLQSEIRSIRVFNVETKETFDVPLQKPTWGEIWYATSQVVGDTYYFGVGRAFGPSLGYKMSLPPTRSSVITKLPQAVGGEINKRGTVHISSSCYEGCFYSLFNPASSTTSPLDRLNAASNERDFQRKEEYLGTDSEGRMILNVRTISEGSKAYDQQPTPLESIVAVPLQNEKVTVPIISASALPAGVEHFYMIDGIDKILMLTDTQAYIFHLKDKSVKEIALGEKFKTFRDLPDSPALQGTKTQTAICFADGEVVSTAVDLVTETYLDTPPADCPKLYVDKTTHEMFEDLKLPETFELVGTSMIYRDITPEK